MPRRGDRAQPTARVTSSTTRRATASVHAVRPPDGDLTVVVHPSAPRAVLSFAGNVEDSQGEFAHVGSPPASLPSVGEMTRLGRGAVERAVRLYVGG